MTESNKQSSKIQTDQACSEMLKDALPILQGLLASGHFTYSFEEGNQPGCYTTDNGSSWNESDEHNPLCFAARFSYDAVTCALNLAYQLRNQIEINVNLEQYTSDNDQ